MVTLRRALVLGIAFALAAVTTEIWLGFGGVVARRMGGSMAFELQVTALELGLGALLGLLAAPLLWLRGGVVWQVLALGAAWFGLQRWVELDAPMFAAMALVPPIGGTLLTLLGLWLARRWTAAPWIAIAVLWCAGMVAGPIYLALTTPEPPPRAALPPAPEGAPDVVLVVLDTVRAGSVGSYGYGRETSPEFDALAAEGALFLDATSPSTWSLPSHASLFTGRYPSSHGAHAEHRYLDDRFPTLAQVLERNGYETHCFTSNAWISDGLGLTRGFASQVQGRSGGGMGFSFVHRLLDRVGLFESDKGGGPIAGEFERWARDRERERPAFVFLNFIEAHFPYHMLPHEHLWQFTDEPYERLRAISMDLMGAQFGGGAPPTEEVVEPARDMYDGGIAYSSRLLHRIVEALRARGTLDETLLVVMSDHGEVLGERAGHFGHGPSLYQESIGVPLLVRYPPRIPKGVRVEQPVSTLGVFATILDLAGLPPSPSVQVPSLVPLARGEASASGGPILSELHVASSMGGEYDLDDPQMHTDRRYRLLREGPLKLVTSSTGQELLYDLAADPRETRDLSAERPRDLARMRGRMSQVMAALDLPPLDAEPAVGDAAPEMDEATRERLRDLGYIE